MSLLSSTGEEIGWRGLFVPELAKVTSYRKTLMISGAVWTLWHLPLILLADYSLPGVPKWYAVLMFTLVVMGINTAICWLRLKSGSFWTAALFHASHNLFIQSIFTPLTIQTKLTPDIIDEFGIGLALVGVVIAIIFLQKGKLLPAVE
jgi:membrane protease YdiL (CAAX protease family)